MPEGIVCVLNQRAARLHVWLPGRLLRNLPREENVEGVLFEQSRSIGNVDPDKEVVGPGPTLDKIVLR